MYSVILKDGKIINVNAIKAQWWNKTGVLKLYSDEDMVGIFNIDNIAGLIKSEGDDKMMTKEKAIMILKDCELNPCVPEDKEAATMAIKALEQESYEDRKSVQKKGKWIFTKTIFDRYGSTVECSSCHKKWKTYEEPRWKEVNKYCSNCGAKMESEK